MSLSVDLPDARWHRLQLSGAWARENHVVTGPLQPGRQSVGSDRGASSHQHNPFMALHRSTTTEDAGEAYGFSLVYSGNFIAEAEVDSNGTTRIRLGISPETFRWTLDPGGAFVTPEAVLVYTAEGFGAMSDAFHSLFRERLARGRWRDAVRPILINNWEATYFGFDEAKLLQIATSARDLGVELFVLDDGWFGERDSDDSSLGDWSVNRRKLPGGLDGLGTKVEALGLRFGIWIEPEMISERSRLFEAHPDWAIGVPGRPRTESRQQLVLDMSRPEIVDHLFEVLSSVFSSAPISYVKWDMNRTITEPFSRALPADRQGEFFHRYILGVYDLYRRLTTAFPEILFESCAGGGGRFDPGMLAFAPQAWTSDDTDAIERLKIQWGTSMAYPISSMGAHVAAVPNHQTGRITPIETRAAVAFFGAFGYELDPTALSDADRTAMAAQIAFYKLHRETFQYGRFARLRSPFEAGRGDTAWMVIDPDGSSAIVAYVKALNEPTPPNDRLRLRGLDPAATYEVNGWPWSDDPLVTDNAGPHGGDELDGRRTVDQHPPARRRPLRRLPGLAVRPGARRRAGLALSRRWRLRDVPDPERLRTRLADRDPIAARAGTKAISVVRAPGRVNLIGEHTDYNDGFVMPAAIGLEIRLAFVPTDDGRVEITLDDSGERRGFDLDAIGPRSGYVDRLRGRDCLGIAGQRATDARLARHPREQPSPGCRPVVVGRAGDGLGTGPARRWTGDRSGDPGQGRPASRECLCRRPVRDHGSVRLGGRDRRPRDPDRLSLARLAAGPAAARPLLDRRLPQRVIPQARCLRLQRPPGRLRAGGGGHRDAGPRGHLAPGRG